MKCDTQRNSSDFRTQPFDGFELRWIKAVFSCCIFTGKHHEAGLHSPFLALVPLEDGHGHGGRLTPQQGGAAQAHPVALHLVDGRGDWEKEREEEEDNVNGR